MPPAKQFSKSKLSMYLRTKCDRELYLSLHTPTVLANHGMPVPLTARPGIGVLKTAGVDFEAAKNAELRLAFPGNTIENGQGGATTDDLAHLLTLVPNSPSIILQARVQPEQFRGQLLTNLGVPAAKQALIPPLGAMIPDIISVRLPQAEDEEVRPDGTRAPIDPGTEARRVLTVIDVKHASEPNASYSAEVALYAYVLANFVVHAGLSGRFFVSAKPQLWTRSSIGNSALAAALAANPRPTPDEMMGALVSDCDDIPFKFYIQTVRRFFQEDILRVTEIGDQDWRQLDWHVDGRCSSCDWLGYRRWLNQADQAKIAAQPDHYCVPNAALQDHLSRVVGVTRGARRTLGQSAITTVAQVAAMTGQEHPYRQHSALRKERLRIPARAAALGSNNVQLDQASVVASLAQYTHLQISVAVNFDASAGMLTGLAAKARIAFPYRANNRIQPQQLGTQAYVVDGKTPRQEWVALESFLIQFENFAQQATQRFIANGFVTAAGVAQRMTAQVVFWEKRQFEELCGALGRHLPRVLALANRRTRALAWLFPPDELIERDDGAVSPSIGFIDETVRRIVSLPVAHVLTLFDAVEHYHYGQQPPRLPDSYHREYLTNGIPRERIYEIWSGADPVIRGQTPHPRANLLANFLRALEAQVSALDNITIRLKIDLGQRLRGRGATLNLSVPRGANGISFDGRLWLWWDQLEFATRGQEDLIRVAESGAVLEAAYLAIRLMNRVQVLGNGDWVFAVHPESAEVKLEDGDGWLAVGADNEPGLPLTALNRHKLPAAAPYPGDPQTEQQPLYSVLRATLVAFDRSNLLATVRFESRDPAFLPYLTGNTSIDLTTSIFLTEGKSSYDPSRLTHQILREIGNPAIAVADPNAAAAMGANAGQPGNDPITPPARALWDAASLQQEAVRTQAEAQAFVQAVTQRHLLNASQLHAVDQAASRRLAVIWGPPGTGKTKTLVSLAHGLVLEAQRGGRGCNILISGPTYKAVEELIRRLVDALVGDGQSQADVYVGYSASRASVQFPNAAPRVIVEGFNIDDADPRWGDCIASLNDNARVTIFATTVHQAHKPQKRIADRFVAPIFDAVILDESSQIPVSRSLSALAARKSTGQLIVAGDHLQMPPIFALEPPVGAEYLIGSIQTYLLKRNFGAAISPLPLLTNYRSGQHLVEFARTIGYPQNLNAAHPGTAVHLRSPIQVALNTLPASLPSSPAWSVALQPNKSALVIVHDDDLSSQSNEFEAKMVAALAHCLRASVSADLDGRGPVVHQAPISTQFWERCVGIVTPHRAQRAAVIRELRQLFPNDPSSEIVDAVDTVEKFQGGERHVVIVSFGVGDPDVVAGEEAFLMQLERTNVAISRAMAKCIVIMPRTLAGHVPEDRAALETAHALKGYVEEFCNTTMDTSFTLQGIARTGQIRWHQ